MAYEKRIGYLTGRETVKRVIKMCVICKKIEGKAFRRFISRRGMPNKILTDNAKTFKAAANEVAQFTVQKCKALLCR